MQEVVEGKRERREGECDTRERTGKLDNLPCPSGHPADENSQRRADEAGQPSFNYERYANM